MRRLPAAPLPWRVLGLLLGLSLAAGALAGCSDDPPPAPALATPSVSPAGVACPTPQEYEGFVQAAFGAQVADAEVATGTCVGMWSATTVRLRSGLEGRIALRNDGRRWTPVLVGGAEGPCPATLAAAPAQIRTILSC